MKPLRLSIPCVLALALLASPVAWACPAAGSSMKCMPDRAPAASEAGCHEAQPAPDECCVVERTAEPRLAVAADDLQPVWRSTVAPITAEADAQPSAGAAGEVLAYPPRAQDSPRFVLYSSFRL